MDDSSGSRWTCDTLADMDPVTALAQLGGVASRAEWQRGLTRSAARSAIERGAVVVLPRRQVALPHLDRAERTAAAYGGVRSHLSAALHHGWRVKHPPRLPTITVPRNRRVPVAPPEAEVHWADLPASDVHAGVTTPLRTAIDCARTYDRDVALCVADSALRSWQVHPDELVAAAERAPRTGRRRALWVAHHANEQADNPFESCLRAIALDVPGLDVSPQGWVGNAGRVDLVDERLMIAIEADSWQFHGAPELFRRDVRRYTEFARLGWVVARFVWEDVMHRPEVVGRHLAQLARVRAKQLGLPLVA